MHFLFALVVGFVGAIVGSKPLASNPITLGVSRAIRKCPLERTLWLAKFYSRQIPAQGVGCLGTRPDRCIRQLP